MSSLAQLSSLLWWLMLLSATAIILQDIGAAILSKTRPREMSRRPKGSTTSTEDEFSVISKKIRRGLQRPASFRTLQGEMAQTIIQMALAANGLPISKIPESRPELVNQILKDPELIRFVQSCLPNAPSKPLIPRGKMLAEFERTVRILEKAEGELR